jgi:hypothetical protein
MRNTWSKTWPKTAGWYWVYGSLHGKTETPEMATCRVWLSGNNVPMRVCSTGAFMYPEEAGECRWMPMQMPAPPEDLS